VKYDKLHGVYLRFLNVPLTVFLERLRSLVCGPGAIHDRSDFCDVHHTVFRPRHFVLEGLRTAEIEG